MHGASDHGEPAFSDQVNHRFVDIFSISIYIAVAVRKHALPKPVEHTNVASKRFLEMMNALIVKVS